ncbi:hypothetical protein AMELA_G00168980 [Ameiurus melas]|uniref:Ig-like domain-containing protein n=1 Tax=Ameiurus melas TaxID=219545 RepID=A0A7J6AET0_AMEME|nr:hypothetical protein AMELA_G00168980 [Ameiurus melas]
MASATLLYFVLTWSSVRVGKSVESLFNMKCQPAVGVIGQTTHISCSIDYFPISINTVVLTRSGEEKPCFTFQPYVNRVTGDSRFKVENGPSLQLHNTAISDEGEYWYLIRTSLGNEKVKFTISVTGKYSNPIITFVPEKIVNGEHADLYCSASGGYPAGTIHWFDRSNTNWTKSATLQSTQGNDGLFTLSSKLSFQKINRACAPYRCVVLNNKYEEEGENTFHLEIKGLFNMKCQPAVGVIGQTTHISCSIEYFTDPKPISINTVVLTRSGEEKPCFIFQPYVNRVTGDSRFEFKAENGPSLQLHNTVISDESKYTYFIQTNRGTDKVKFTISVTSKYSNPIITSMPEEVVDGEHADLYCNASGGYPAGTIHWFDQSNTNWTKSTTLQSTQGNDGLFTLSSKLSFQKINRACAPYRCVVLNNKYEEEGENTFHLERKDIPLHTPAGDSIVKNSIAPLVLIGSLIVGLLIVRLLKRSCDSQLKRVISLDRSVDFSKDPDDVEDEKALIEPI